ncbi:hypothetical protein DID76_04265 [Candidatus Marinamargulisbacteria bacterium SCGC AG-414-C22]|nr:hypothetical protein DID76_04265 [Candidatus Marinamargulisbacteria bacterium SCGC AG-414-C22]
MVGICTTSIGAFLKKTVVKSRPFIRENRLFLGVPMIANVQRGFHSTEGGYKDNFNKWDILNHESIADAFSHGPSNYTALTYVNSIFAENYNSAIDIGSGQGWFLSHLRYQHPDAQLCAIDTSSVALSRLKGKNITLYNRDVNFSHWTNKLPLGSVVNADMITPYLSDLPQFVKQLAQLDPSLLLIRVPVLNDPRNVWFTETYDDYSLTDVTELRELVHDNFPDYKECLSIRTRFFPPFGLSTFAGKSRLITTQLLAFSNKFPGALPHFLPFPPFNRCVYPTISEKEKTGNSAHLLITGNRHSSESFTSVQRAFPEHSLKMALGPLHQELSFNDAMDAHIVNVVLETKQDLVVFQQRFLEYMDNLADEGVLCINLYKRFEQDVLDNDLMSFLSEANPSLFFPYIEKYMLMVSSEGTIQINDDQGVSTYQLSRLVLRKSPVKLDLTMDSIVPDLVLAKDCISLETCRYFKKAVPKSLGLSRHLNLHNKIAQQQWGFLFPNYGDIGHELAHLKRKNVMRDDEVESLINIILAKFSLSITSHSVDFTFNRYVPSAGFQWHVDTQANGETTCVIALTDTIMEFDKLPDSHQGKFGVISDYQPQNPYRLTLEKGSILFFSKSARYDYAHRVIPSSNQHGVSFNIALGFTDDLSSHLNKLM